MQRTTLGARWLALPFCALAAILFIAGCSSTGASNLAGQVPGTMVSDADEGYRAGPGDVLEITVYGEESLNRSNLVVRPDGKVSFPLVGDIEVGGLTTAEIKDALEEKLREYIPGAVSSVGIVQLGSLQFYVVGKVNKPGVYNISQPMTVMQALALAGGPTPFASENKILIVRSHGRTSLKVPFNYKEVKRGNNLSQNILLNRGDVVVVP